MILIGNTKMLYYSRMNLSTSSSLSTAEIEEIIEILSSSRHRDSTKKNYYSVWRTFNQFFIWLDRKPDSWEERITLFAAHLIQMKKKSSMVKSYVSVIKAVLSDMNVTVNEVYLKFPHLGLQAK